MSDLARGFTRDDAPEEETGPDDDITIVIGDPEGAPQPDSDGTIDPGSGALKIEVGEDGSVIIDLNPQPKPKGGGSADDFDANLAEHISDGELSRIGSELFQAIQADDQSRQEWLETRAKGIDLLGFKIEEPRGDTGASTAPVEGMSTVRHPLLTEAVIRFQSNASAELLPASGPVKVRNDSPSPPSNPDETPMPGYGHNGGPPLDGSALPGFNKDDLANALEKDLNHYLTKIDKGYRADTDRMLFWVGFGGAAFKKVYNCPIKRMPISRSVDAADLIVANSANDIDDAGRVTHRIQMRRSTLIRMQLAGVYRQIEGLTMLQPQEQPNAVDQKIANIQGFAATRQRPEDNNYTIYESYVELDIAGFEHKDGGKPTGLELPYRVTMEKDTQRILEIRRNWEKDDENCMAKRVFVKFPFIPALGFYDIGLLQVLGNATKGLTAAWRMMLDAGMFASFPGFLYADSAGRQVTNEFRVPPGGGMKIQTGGNRPIQDVVMPLPYKDVTPGLSSLVEKIEVTGQRVGGTAELQVGEGKQDAPVGTTLALIEQATKMLAAVHIRLHAAQSEEFQLLKARFREDPSALWRNNRRPARKWEVEEFLAALEACDVVPAADPNTASHMQRIMTAVAVKQLQAASPDLYNAKAVDLRIMRDIGVADPEQLFATPEEMAAKAAAAAGQGQGPSRMAELQLRAQQLKQKQDADMANRMADATQSEKSDAARQQEVAVESADRAADRESRERVAQMREETEKVKADAMLAAKHADVGADIMKSHAEQQAGLATQQAETAADHQKRVAGLAADNQKHVASLAADQAQSETQAGLQRGGMVSDHLKHQSELAQADRHHREKMEQTERHAAAEAERAAAEREAKAKEAKANPKRVI